MASAHDPRRHARRSSSTTRVRRARSTSPLVHESVRAELAARRQGTHATKTRGNVRGGGAKPWRQKGTGRARAGSSRSPIWTGGGIVFGPSPRHYTFKVNRKERRAALRSALSVHAERGSIAVFDPAPFVDTPSTKKAAELLADWRRRAPCSSSSTEDAGSAPRCRSATSTRVSVLPVDGRRRRRPHRRGRRRRLPGGARRADRPRERREATDDRGGERPDGSEPGHHPPGRQREELRARGGRQVHVPRPPRRAQDPDPPGGRGALRRQGRRGPHDVGEVQAQAARADQRAHARVEEGRSCRCARATRSRSSRACRASRR